MYLDTTLYLHIQIRYDDKVYNAQTRYFLLAVTSTHQWDYKHLKQGHRHDAPEGSYLHVGEGENTHLSTHRISFSFQQQEY